MLNALDCPGAISLTFTDVSLCYDLYTCLIVNNHINELEHHSATGGEIDEELMSEKDGAKLDTVLTIQNGSTEVEDARVLTVVAEAVVDAEEGNSVVDKVLEVVDGRAFENRLLKATNTWKSKILVELKKLVRITLMKKIFRTTVVENFGSQMCIIFRKGHQIESYSISGKDVMPDLVQDVETVDDIAASSIQCGASLEDHMSVIKEPLAKGGFCWVGTQKMVDADDCTRDNYIKALKINADASLLLRRVIQNIDDLLMIILKSWKKQYALVKELLAYNGFKWDEKQKMVAATSSWNDYIKA
ncbi:Myb/SANT-like domain [Dillenia turbinata]|uniref:Myb/SANT-like domain n=1 Tax=Dillenia turbinata TaxID=194707 RepID=A0AAN8Z3U7_9MAGN